MDRPAQGRPKILRAAKVCVGRCRRRSEISHPFTHTHTHQSWRAFVSAPTRPAFLVQRSRHAFSLCPPDFLQSSCEFAPLDLRGSGAGGSRGSLLARGRRPLGRSPLVPRPPNSESARRRVWHPVPAAPSLADIAALIRSSFGPSLGPASARDWPASLNFADAGPRVAGAAFAEAPPGSGRVRPDVAPGHAQKVDGVERERSDVGQVGPNFADSGGSPSRQ